MSTWLREVAGWILLGVGLAAFTVCYFVFLLNRRVIEAAALGFIGFTVFRGGMHLLKVAMASRAAREASKAAKPSKVAPVAIRQRESSAAGRQRPSVVPGASSSR